MGQPASRSGRGTGTSSLWPPSRTGLWGVGSGAAWALGVLLLLPVLSLFATSPWQSLQAGFGSERFWPALAVSLRTTAVSLAAVVTLGTPLAWWLARHRSRWTEWVGLLLNLPVVLPPAALGLGLLLAYGRSGWLGPLWEALSMGLPFSPWAVCLAQVVVSAPFYVQAASNAFGAIDPQMLAAARTLGATAGQAWRQVALPLCLPGLFGGAALAWARALGEFGATLLFAGNLPGSTQTLPLAIYATFETDVREAQAMALALTLTSAVILAGLRWAPSLLGWSFGPKPSHGTQRRRT